MYSVLRFSEQGAEACPMRCSVPTRTPFASLAPGVCQRMSWQHPCARHHLRTTLPVRLKLQTAKLAALFAGLLAYRGLGPSLSWPIPSEVLEGGSAQRRLVIPVDAPVRRADMTARPSNSSGSFCRRTGLNGLVTVWLLGGGEPSSADLSVQGFSGDAANRTRQLRLWRKSGGKDAPYRRALADCQRDFGKQSRQSLAALDDLAVLLLAQERPVEAEQCFREELMGCRLLLGPDHPDTLWSASNLAVALKQQGRLNEAEGLFTDTLARRVKLLGADHPDSLASKNNYAVLLKREGRLVEAEALYRETLRSRRLLLGNQHADTLTTANNLAVLLSDTGRTEEAEELYREALTGSRERLGAGHPDTLLSMDNLAVFFFGQYRLSEAEPLFRNAIAGFKDVLGAQHPDTLRSMDNLAVLLMVTGRLQEAESLLREAVGGFRSTLGAAHPDTLASEKNLADVVAARGEEAAWIRARAVSAPVPKVRQQLHSTLA
mmetsp:Transcript_120179/g.340225  ORF Transcript_120179/g.340225 Transcript_120179/m.340225 type:complete len:490 (+) Transcript_120179:1-1470(+)